MHSPLDAVVIFVAQWSRTFDGKPAEVAQARHFVRLMLTGRPVLDAAELVVSELATNALAFSASGHPGGWFVVEVRADPGFARVAVADLGGSAEPPVSPSGQPDGIQTGGRGLYIVASLAKQWGWEPTGAGRRVWAELADDSL